MVYGRKKEKKLPDFYNIEKMILEETNPNLFVGRKKELESFWKYLELLKNNDRVNIALTSTHKIGKTSFLKRFFNVVYLEQEEVIPIYFSFPTYSSLGLSIEDIANKMALTWIAQSGSFLLDEDDLAYIKDEEELKEILTSKSNKDKERLLKIWERYKIYSKDRKSGGKIEEAFNVVEKISANFQRPIVLILDEAQELVTSIKDENKNLINGIEFLNSIVNNPRIWVILSSAKSYVVHKEIVQGTLANRITESKFLPLSEEETEELVDRIIEYWNYEAYDEIGKDIYNLVNGNPFYIHSIFDPRTDYSKYTAKDKCFESLLDLIDVFSFEVRHPAGRIFQFWDSYLNSTKNILETAKPEVTYQILFYIYSHLDRNIPLRELAQKFKIRIEEVEERVNLLFKADLIENTSSWGETKGFRDNVLSIILLQTHYQDIFKYPTESRREEAIVDIIGNLLKDRGKEYLKKKKEERAKKDKKLVEENKEYEKIKKAILSGKGEFSKYKNYDLQLEKVKKEGATSERTVDLFGFPKEGRRRKGKKLNPVAIIIKSHRRKLSIDRVRHILETFELLKKKYNLKHLDAYLIAEVETSEKVKKLIEKSKVNVGTPEDFDL